MIKRLLNLTQVRFVLVGGTCAVFQVMLAYSILELLPIINPIIENIVNLVSFVTSVQFNFFLSTNYTWKERIGNPSPRQQFKNYIGFNSMMCGTLILNQSGFALVNLFIPALYAVIVGILLAALSNWFISSRLLFRSTKQGAHS